MLEKLLVEATDRDVVGDKLSSDQPAKDSGTSSKLIGRRTKRPVLWQVHAEKQTRRSSYQECRLYSLSSLDSITSQCYVLGQQQQSRR
ncbi:hypothetical protein CO675_00240 [Bradyrhizobium sp. C9]|nr:hypothetical protein CO675_00240 [Bradyrhizobium sp. C9]